MKKATFKSLWIVPLGSYNSKQQIVFQLFKACQIFYLPCHSPICGGRLAIASKIENIVKAFLKY